MKKYSLRRAGHAPLVFTGIKIASASSFQSSEGIPSMRKALSRWHEVDVYESSAGLYVLGIAFRSTWIGEPEHYDAVTFRDLAELLAWLEAVDPCAHIVGVPEGVEDSGKKNAAIRKNCVARWESMISYLMNYLPELSEEVK